MDSKLAIGLAREDLRKRGKAFDSYMDAHHRLMLPAVKLLRRPKMSREDASALFRRLSLSQRSIPGQILTHEFSDPDAKPVNGRFDKSVATIHCTPEKRSIEGKQEDVIELALHVTRVTRQKVVVIQKNIEFAFRHHAISRYIERSGKAAAELCQDIAQGLLVNLSSPMTVEDPVRPLVVPTKDGAFLGLSFLHYLPRELENGGGLILGHREFRTVEGVPGASEWGANCWLNTYIHESDMSRDQQSLLDALRQADAAGQRSMMTSLIRDHFGELANECLPTRLPQEDTRYMGELDDWLRDVRNNPGWGRMMRTVRDGLFKELAEKAIRFRDERLPVALDEIQRMEEADRIASLLGLGGDRDEPSTSIRF